MKPIDPVQTAAWLTTAINFCQVGLTHFIAQATIDADSRAAMSGLLTMAQNAIDSPAWAKEVQRINDEAIGP